jgi:hypothetical protein
MYFVFMVSIVWSHLKLLVVPVPGAEIRILYIKTSKSSIINLYTGVVLLLSLFFSELMPCLILRFLVDSETS